jgi:DDE family transposase
MSTILTDLAPTLQRLFTVEADDAAQRTGFCRRRRQLDGPRFAQTLVFGWLHQPQATLDELVDAAAHAGADVTPTAFSQRFTPQAAAFLEDLLHQALHHVFAGQPFLAPLLQRFQGVYLWDSTVLTLPAALAAVWPGCGSSRPGGQAALKALVCLELSTGALVDLSLHAGRATDRGLVEARDPLPPGALRLADLGFFDLKVFRDYSEQGVFWVSRLPSKVAVFDAQGERLSLADWLRRRSDTRIEEKVQVGVSERLPCRLVAWRVPKSVARKRQERLRKEARRKGRRVSAERLALCEWMLYLTNTSQEQLSWRALWVLARCRWQIELLFKLWKSEGGLEESRGRQPWRVLCEVYAKLLGMVVQQWLLLSSATSFVKQNTTARARRVRGAALRILACLTEAALLLEALTRLRQRLETAARRQKRRRRLAAWQRLLDPEQVDEQEWAA